jgi:hypothetical protein
VWVDKSSKYEDANNRYLIKKWVFEAKKGQPFLEVVLDEQKI